MSDLRHECGVAAIYHFKSNDELSPLCPGDDISSTSRLMPRMLLDIQNRGQLSAGISAYTPPEDENSPGKMLTTHKDLGTVSEVFRLSHKGKSQALLDLLSGRAAIGHVRYSTCGADDIEYAQPFVRHHLQKHKFFALAFNGQLANYDEIRHEMQSSSDDYHFALDSDTEILMYEISRQFSGDRKPTLPDMMKTISEKFDGAYSLALLNAKGDMLVARDPMGIKPMCYAFDDSLFAAASESVALLNLGFESEKIYSLEPGHAIIVTQEKGVEIVKYTESPKKAHCFFEWIYFANVASTLDDRSVYVSRTKLGEELAKIERERKEVPIDENTIVVPVPDTSKAAADSMAYELGIPSREGLIRNRYSGRTFIEGGAGRMRKAETKYTPLRQVLEGKRVFLVEDSIVRSTTMKVLIKRLRKIGKVKEIHVRVACPPILAPCFYGINMPTIQELFAPKFVDRHDQVNEEVFAEMAKEIGCDSLRYLPLDSIANSIRLPSEDLCQACLTGEYPTKCGQNLYQLEWDKHEENRQNAKENSDCVSNSGDSCKNSSRADKGEGITPPACEKQGIRIGG